MSGYPNDGARRFDQQFAESEGERNARLAMRRKEREAMTADIKPATDWELVEWEAAWVPINSGTLTRARRETLCLIARLRQEQRRAEAAERVVEAAREIAESRDAGRHDGLPEPCPAHGDIEMWSMANDALAAYDAAKAVGFKAEN